MEDKMTLEEAIRTAIDYETRVRDTYLESLQKAADSVGKRVFRVLGEEEQGHVDFLINKLEEWKESGQVSSEELETVVPPPQVLEEGVLRLDNRRPGPDLRSELDMLRKALQLEIETSNFYESMVDELGDEGTLFARFLEIEKGHQALVQAEIDYLNNTGFYFDFQEFSTEY
jgi:rubrerythrin